MLATVRVALPEGLRRLRVPREVRPIVCRPMQHELVKVGLTERATRAENIEAAASLIVREERHRRPVRSSVTERVIIDVELWQRRSNGWGRHRSGIAVASQWHRSGAAPQARHRARRAYQPAPAGRGGASRARGCAVSRLAVASTQCGSQSLQLHAQGHRAFASQRPTAQG